MKAYLCRRKRAFVTQNRSMSRRSVGDSRRGIKTAIICLNLGITDLTAFESTQFGEAAENWNLLSKLKNSEWMSSKPSLEIILETQELRWTNRNVDFTMEGPLLDSLIKSLAHLNLKVSLQVFLLDELQVGVSSPDCDISEMSIRTKGNGQQNGAFCKESGGGISEQLGNELNANGHIVAVEVSLIIGADKKRELGGEGDLACADVNKKLLMEEVRTDLEIIAGNGVAVKCLSAFLVVQSEVIRAMLETDMQENKDNRILMEDVSENGVRALLAYLYYRDLEIPMRSSVLAVELLELSHKYLIGGLEDTVKGILLDKPAKWFEAKAVVRLFFFSGKLDNHKDLRMKAVQVIQSKPNEVMACEEYQRLFQVEEEDVGMEGISARLKAVKELCDALLSATLAGTLPSPCLAEGVQNGYMLESTTGANGVKVFKIVTVNRSSSKH